MLENAKRAFAEGFGAGSIIDLRKAFEKITHQTAHVYGIDITLITKKGKEQRKSFKQLLTEVDSKCHIIPKEFSENGYKLFGELSDVVHGEYEEDIALSKFNAFYRLVVGVIENVKNNRELMEAIGELF